jgi:hypothetical protein
MAAANAFTPAGRTAAGRTRLRERLLRLQDGVGALLCGACLLLLRVGERQRLVADRLYGVRLGPLGVGDALRPSTPALFAAAVSAVSRCTWSCCSLSACTASS